MRLLLACTGPVALLAALAIALPTHAPRSTTPAPFVALMNVAAMKPLNQAEVANASATIDALVEARLTRLGVPVPPPASDAQFVRRAYLAIIGRIPTTDETMAFLGSTASEKRRVLIDRLVASDARVHHEFTWWADLLRVQSRMNNRPGQPFIDWLKESLRKNEPYDRMVHTMLTAEGPALAPGNGATGFWLRDAGMPLDRVANISQVFLGTQIGCAQCHDHPFDAWKRRQFFEFSAYLHGSDARRQLPGGRDTAKAIKAREKELSDQERQVLRRIGDSIGLRVNSTTKATIALPEDYQYDDAKPKDNVQATVLFGSAAPVGKGQDPRATFAQWMTSAENPRFAQVIANRLWQRAFGVGLIEPIDDLRDDSVAVEPELMDFLTRLMIAHQFDVRAFQKTLYHTKAWQRQALRGDHDPAIPPTFAGPLAQRLTAEQMWDSLLTLAVTDLDRKRGSDAAAVHAFYNDHKDLSADAIIDLAKNTVKAREIGQQLRKRGDVIRTQLRQSKGKEAETLRTQLTAIQAQRMTLDNRFDAMRYRDGGQNNGLLRAAELSQPSGPGHFLRVWGQSDRELIDNATASPAVTQALHLMNGPLESELFKKDSPLVTTLAKATDDVSRARAVYLTMLSRLPDADELRLAAAYLQRYGDEGLRDLVWALVNANEFRFSP